MMNEFGWSNQTSIHFHLCFSEGSLKLASEGTETGRSFPYTLSGLSNSFAFKIQDKKGRMHRFTCGMKLF